MKKINYKEMKFNPYFTLCVMDKSFKKQMAYLGSVSGRDDEYLKSE